MKVPNIDDIKEGKHTLSLHASHGCYSANIICHAEEEDQCRLECVAGCESWPCYGYTDDGIQYSHPLTDSGECQASLFIENSDDIWSCAAGDFPLHDGMEVSLEWEGDYYTWAAKNPPPVEGCLNGNSVIGIVCGHPESAHNVWTFTAVGMCNRCQCPQFVTQEMFDNGPPKITSIDVDEKLMSWEKKSGN